MYLVRLLAFIGLSLSIFGCDSNQQSNKNETSTELDNSLEEKSNFGFFRFVHQGKASEAYDNFLQILQANPGVEIVGSLDHQSNAKNAGLEMPFAKVVYVYNQFQATPIIQENPLAGLDLPTRIAFFSTEKENLVQFFDESYYISKFNLNNSVQNAESASRVYLKTIESFLENPTSTSIQHPVEEGIIYQEKSQDFDTTAKQIVTNIANDERVDLFFAIDHQSLAKKYEQELGKSILLFVGNAESGTKLMLEQPSLSFDLPLKILVFETNGGKTGVAYNDMSYIFERHHIENKEPSVKMNKILANLTQTE